MKLTTNIRPRLDGTVKARGADGVIYEFKPDASGELVGDVTDHATIAMLVATENFIPVDEADFEQAFALAGGNTAEPVEEDDLDDDLVMLGAAPVEANTPPAPARAAGHSMSPRAARRAAGAAPARARAK